MSLQDNSILSIPCHVALALFKSFALGTALFFSFSFVFWFFFFPAVIGCQHDLHLLKIRNGKKKKKSKSQKRPKSKQLRGTQLPAGGNQALSEGRKCGHSGATGTPPNQETHTPELHSQKHRTVRRYSSEEHYLLHTPLFSTFLISSQDRTSVSHFDLIEALTFKIIL